MWGGSFIRRGAKILGGCAKVAGTVAAAPARYGSKAIGAGLEFIGAERLGRTIEHGGEVGARIVEAPSRVADLVIRQAANGGTKVISDITGDDADSIEAELETSEAFDSFTDHFSGIAENLCDAVDQFSGRVLYDKAKRAYSDIKKEKRRLQRQLDKEREDLRIAINLELRRINSCRKGAGLQFRRFEEVARKIANWDIAEYEHTEVFGDIKLTLSPMTSESTVFTDVNFDESPIQNYLKGLLTGGLLIDSQVKEVNLILDGLNKAMKDEVDQAKAEQLRWEKTMKSLEMVRENFEEFIRFYTRLVQELEYALTMLRMNYLQRDLEFFSVADSELNVYFLPQRHLKCLMACDKMSRILCTMSKQCYLDKSAVDMKKGEVAKTRECARECKALKVGLAA